MLLPTHDATLPNLGLGRNEYVHLEALEQYLTDFRGDLGDGEHVYMTHPGRTSRLIGGRSPFFFVPLKSWIDLSFFFWNF